MSNLMNDNFVGLCEKEVAESRAKYGSNEIASGKKRSFARQFLSNFGDPIIRVLLIALALNLLFTLNNFNWFESIGIVMAIAIATLVSTISEYGSELAFEKLCREASELFCMVRRDGREDRIPVSEIVCGDVVLLSAGEMIPADGILAAGALTVDQSSLNGECDDVRKFPTASNTIRDLSCPSALFRGTLIRSGQGTMIARAVGESTMYGSLASELLEITRESPLKIRLRKLAKTISMVGYIAASAVAFAYFFNSVFIDSSFNSLLIAAKLTDSKFMLSCLLHCLTLAVTVVVVAVPEGLPMMITVVLSANMKRMLSDNILVRKLVGIETAGSMNIMFTDKTGTLTTGEQSVAWLILGDKSEYSSVDMQTDMLAVAAFCCSDCILKDGKALGGNSSDRALAEFLGKKGQSIAAKYKTLDRVPFDSKNKYAACEVEGRDGRYTLVKGAPEKILPCVTSYHDKNGKKIDHRPDDLSRTLSDIAERSYRVIAIATSDTMVHDDKMPEMTLVCLCVIKDEIRADAKRSVEIMRGAGIQTVMVTGDHKKTAETIAKRCGIVTDYGKQIVMESSELAKFSDEELADILPHLAVVARALPDDKTRLVRIAQNKGLVVGMTGDGINDAPALKKADVGFAMGSGTDIAREAGDILLLDNNFAYIARSVLYGRTIFKSIRKFIMFQLTMNFCAVAVSIIGPFIGIDTPVTVVQMLWVNIIMDTLGGLAFAGEPAVESTMIEKPKRRDEGLVNRPMAAQIAFCSIFTLSVCIVFLKLPMIRTFFGYNEDPRPFMSAFFGLFIFLGVINCFIARTPRINLAAHIKKNRGFVFIMIAVSIVQLTMIYFGGDLFRAAPLSPKHLLFVFGLSLLILPFETARRIILRLKYGYRSTV